MHSINIHNKSNHDQEFEVHGWNENRNVVVKPHATVVLHAADKSSGAIIALHDGHEGEQAEITKDGFMGPRPFPIIDALCMLIVNFQATTSSTSATSSGPGAT